MTNKRLSRASLNEKEEAETVKPASWSDVETVEEILTRADQKYPTLPSLLEPEKKEVSTAKPLITAPRRKLDDDPEVVPANLVEAYIHKLGQRNFVIKRKDIPDSPAYFAACRKLTQDGYLRKVGRNDYMYQPQRLAVGASTNPWPKRAIFCLETAVWLHNNSDIVPLPVFVAIDYQSPLPLPYSTYRVKPIPDKNDFLFGLSTVTIGGLSYRVYSRERTIVDLLSYQSKRTGRLETAERALVSWWKNGFLSLSGLSDAAKLRSVEEEIRPYLAMLPHIPKVSRRQRR